MGAFYTNNVFCKYGASKSLKMFETHALALLKTKIKNTHKNNGNGKIKKAINTEIKHQGNQIDMKHEMEITNENDLNTFVFSSKGIPST